MAFKTKRDLLDWLEQGDGCGNALIGREWVVWIDNGHLYAQHPTCPDIGVSFCPTADDEEEE